MKIILIVVLFAIILLFNICCAYMPVYHVANQDLLKGILLGALLTQHKPPPHFLNVMPMPYYNNYANQQQSYAYPSPTSSAEHNHDSNHRERERQTDQTNDSSQQIEGQQQENESQQQQHHHHEQTSHSQPQPHHHQEHYHQHQQQNPQLEQRYHTQNRHQPSESLFEPVVTDPPVNRDRELPNQLPSQIPKRSEPVIPSMESIQRNLGFPGHSVILMILPSLDTNNSYNKEHAMPSESREPVRTELATESPEQEQHSSEQQMIDDYNNNLKTNAIKIGSKNLNSKGWKPVPKAATTTPMTTTTTTESSAQQEYNDRINRYNMNKYIERSQFGLRNKDINQLNRDLNQYYSIDQMHD